MNKPTQAQLAQALKDASNAHHEFEANYLGGLRDESWAAWYAAYVMGNLGEFIAPSTLTQWLAAANPEGDWAEGTAQHIVEQLG